MHRFWDHGIKHVLILAEPRKVVEIGSLTGITTFKLLQYCKHLGGHRVVVDPSPQYDIALLREHYGKEFVTILEQRICCRLQSRNCRSRREILSILID